jgi:hypothetical protein
MKENKSADNNNYDSHIEKKLKGEDKKTGNECDEIK